MNWLPRWILVETPAYRRVEQEYDRFELDPNRVPETGPLLDKARSRMYHGDLDGAWYFIQEARRLGIARLDENQLENAEEILGLEAAAKIEGGWRRAVVQKLLASPPKPIAARRQNLERAQEAMDGHYQSQYYKGRLLRKQLRHLVIISLCAVAVLLVLLGMSRESLTTWPEWDWRTLLSVMLFGILGAGFSATRNAAADSKSSRIPELSTEGWVSVARTVLGATPALAAYAFLKADMIRIVNVQMATVLAVAFAAGFSERLLLKVLETFSGPSQSQGKGKP